MKNAVWFVFVLAGTFVAGVVGIRLFQGGFGVAPTPAALVSERTLESAIEESGKTGKPVLAVVTADWCMPCQALKRGTLSDPEVEAWINENTVSVSINADVNRAEAQRLGASAIPATVVLRNGEIVGHIEGNMPKGEYLDFLKATAAGP